MPSPVPALASARHAERAFAVTLAAYLLSAAALVAVGVTPTIGWTLLLLLLFALSFAYGLARGLFLVGTLLRGRPSLVPPVGIALGFAVTWCYRLQNPVVLLCSFFLLAIVGVDCRRDRARLRYLAAVVGTLFAGFRTERLRENVPLPEDSGRAVLLAAH